MTNTDALTGKLLQVINQVQAGIISKTPEAVTLVLQQTQVNAIGNILSCIAGIILIYIFWKVYLKIKGIKDEYDDINIGVTIYIAATGVLSTIFIIGIFSTLFDIWTYINPKLYLAHQIIGKVLS
jgi:riboflavin transporter FmnP